MPEFERILQLTPLTYIPRGASQKEIDAVIENVAEVLEYDPAIDYYGGEVLIDKASWDEYIRLTSLS